MSEIVRCKDRWGRQVVLTEGCWEHHVLSRRRYFRGHERDCVQTTIELPDFVVHDADYPNRENFYRRSPLPRPFDRVFVKVVVEFRPSGSHGDEGEVVTVHLTDRQKVGERQKWP